MLLLPVFFDGDIESPPKKCFHFCKMKAIKKLLVLKKDLLFKNGFEPFLKRFSQVKIVNKRTLRRDKGRFLVGKVCTFLRVYLHRFALIPPPFAVGFQSPRLDNHKESAHHLSFQFLTHRTATPVAARCARNLQAKCIFVSSAFVTLVCSAYMPHKHKVPNSNLPKMDPTVDM